MSCQGPRWYRRTLSPATSSQGPRGQQANPVHCHVQSGVSWATSKPCPLLQPVSGLVVNERTLSAPISDRVLVDHMLTLSAAPSGQGLVGHRLTLFTTTCGQGPRGLQAYPVRCHVQSGASWATGEPCPLPRPVRGSWATSKPCPLLQLVRGLVNHRQTLFSAMSGRGARGSHANPIRCHVRSWDS